LQTGLPRVSLLDLPNDTLLSILEQVCQDLSDSSGNSGSFRVAEILVNKRFYSLARFVWFRNLDIDRSQRDVRLAGLIDDTNASNKARRLYLRSLSIVLTNSFYHVLTSVVVCLPHLTTLSIEIDEDARTSAITALADGISTLSELKELTLSSIRIPLLNRFYERYKLKRPNTSTNITLCRWNHLLWSCETKNGLFCEIVQDIAKGIRSDFDFDWTKLLSLNLNDDKDGSLWAQSLLSALESAIANGVSLICQFVWSRSTDFFRPLETLEWSRQEQQADTTTPSRSQPQFETG